MKEERVKQREREREKNRETETDRPFIGPWGQAGGESEGTSSV